METHCGDTLRIHAHASEAAASARAHAPVRVDAIREPLDELSAQRRRYEPLPTSLVHRNALMDQNPIKTMDDTYSSTAQTPSVYLHFGLAAKALEPK